MADTSQANMSDGSQQQMVAALQSLLQSLQSQGGVMPQMGMPTSTPAPVSQTQAPEEAQQKFWTQIISSLIGIVPGILGSMGKDFSPGQVGAAVAPRGPLPEEAQQKIFAALLPALLGLVPGLFGAIGKDFSPGQVGAAVAPRGPLPEEAQQKIFAALLPALLGLLPGIIGSMSKEFSSGQVGAAPAPFPQVQGAPSQTAMPNQLEVQQKFWTEVFSSLIGIVPGLIGAVRR